MELHGMEWHSITWHGMRASTHIYIQTYIHTGTYNYCNVGHTECFQFSMTFEDTRHTKTGNGVIKHLQVRTKFLDRQTDRNRRRVAPNGERVLQFGTSFVATSHGGVV